jgi:hypothetical protein
LKECAKNRLSARLSATFRDKVVLLKAVRYAVSVVGEKYRMALVIQITLRVFCMTRGGISVRRLRLLTLTLKSCKALAPLTRKTQRNGEMVFEKKCAEGMEGRLNLRCPLSEELQIREDADIAGISISEMVRARYFGRPVVANADKVMIKELRRLGGLLKSVHLESNGAYSKQTANMLAQVSSYITELSKKK